MVYQYCLLDNLPPTPAPPFLLMVYTIFRIAYVSFIHSVSSFGWPMSYLIQLVFNELYPCHLLDCPCLTFSSLSFMTLLSSTLIMSYLSQSVFHADVCIVI